MKVNIVGYLGNDKRNWAVYNIKGLAPTLMAGGAPNKKRNCHQSTHKIWIVVFKRNNDGSDSNRSKYIKSGI